MNGLDKLRKLLRYGGGLLPRLGIRRPLVPVETYASKVISQPGSTLTFTPAEREFLKLCRENFALPDYQQGYPVPESWHAVLDWPAWHADSGALCDPMDKAVLQETIFDLESYPHTRISNPMGIMKHRKVTGLYTSIIRHPWSENNYYHWMCDCLPRLHTVLEYLDSMSEEQVLHLLVHENLRQFQKDTLQLVIGNDPRIKVIPVPENEIWHTQRFVWTSWLSGTGSGAIPNRTADFLRDRLCAGIPQGKFAGSRFYISRSKARNRKILNEDQLLPVFRAHGIEVLCMEDLGFQDQMALFRDAQLVIAGHGAGLSSLMVARNCKVLELFAANNHRAFFFLLAKSMKLPYLSASGGPMDKDENFTLDPRVLNEALSGLDA